MGASGASLRVYVTGRVRVEAGAVLLDEPDLPGRQGRLVLALLVGERDRAVPHEELAEQLWGPDLPAAWDGGLRALLSKLRSVLQCAGLPPDALSHAFGCYQLHLPHDAWAYVGYHITRRPFLPGEDGPWATRFRARLQGLRLRALDCVVELNGASGELSEAVLAAEDALALDPLREATYQRYMRALAAGGDRVEALRVWQRCQQALADELGVSPSTATEAVYLDILRTG